MPTRQNTHLEQLNRGALANTLGTVARFALGVVSFPLLIRILGVARFGDWVLVQSFSGFLILLELGVSSALSVRVASSPDAARLEASARAVSTAGGLLAGLGAVACGGLTVLAVSGHAWWPGEPVPGVVWVACGAAAPGMAFRLAQLWLLGLEAGVGDYALQARLETLSVALTTLGTVGLASLGCGLPWLAGWSSVAVVITCALHWYGLRQRHGFRVTWAFDGLEARRLLSFGVKHWLANLGGLLFTRGDRLVVFALLGREAAGIYAAAVSIVSRINELAAVPVQPIVPAMAQARAQDDAQAPLELFRLTLERSFSFGVLLGGGVMAAAPLLSMVYVASAVPEFPAVLCIMAAAYVLFSGGNAGHYSNLALRHPGRNAALTLLGGVLALSGIALGAWLGGLWWCAAANALYAVVLVLNVLAGRDVGMPPLELLTRHARFGVVVACWGGVAVLFARTGPGLGEALSSFVVGGVGASLSAAWLDPSDARAACQWLSRRFATAKK